jgi:hypothetical protein
MRPPTIQKAMVLDPLSLFAAPCAGNSYTTPGET